MTNNNPPQNYKNSEIGIIPQDWKIHTLRDEIASLNAGISVNSVNTVVDINNDYVILKTSSVSCGFFNPLESKKIIPIDIHRAKLNPQKDSIIISRMNTPDLVGECGYVTESYPNVFLPDRLWMIEFKKTSKVNSRWLSYILSYSTFRQKIRDIGTGTSGSMKNISKDKLLEISIPFPPPKEQTAIANALSDADALISSLEKLIEKKRNIKQGAMQKLLQPKEGWEVKKLGEICDVRDGTHDSPIYYDNGITFITSKNIIKGKIDFNDISHISSEDAFKINQRSKVDKGDILMSMIGTIGNAVLIDFEPDFCIKNIALLKPKSINPVFLIQLIYSSHFQKYIENKLDGGIQKFISLGVLRYLEISVPTPKEQTRIATILSDMDAVIEGLEAKLEKYRAIKLGMMQELLTGKTRLV